MELTTNVAFAERLASAIADPLICESGRDALMVIARHRGAANAIMGREILEEIGIDPDGDNMRRWLKGAVADFVERLHVPIGALRMPPYGYFLIVTREDLDLAIQPLLGEIHSLLRRMRALTSPEDTARLVGQAMLRLDAPEADAPRKDRP